MKVKIIFLIAVIALVFSSNAYAILSASDETNLKKVLDYRQAKANVTKTVALKNQAINQCISDAQDTYDAQINAYVQAVEDAETALAS